MKSIHRIMILHIHQPSSINYWILDPGVGSKKKKKEEELLGDRELRMRSLGTLICFSS